MLRRLLKTFGKPAGDAAAEPPKRSRINLLLEGVRDQWAAEAATSGSAPLTLLYRMAVRREVAEGASASGLEGEAFDRFAEAWCALLAENARLPEHLQIPESSLALPRNLLQAYFGDQTALAREAQAMLRYVEQQFGAGGYAQVEILLRLFETEAVTQRNNERNIFFERCNRKLLTSRERASQPRTEAWQAAMAESLKRPGEGLATALTAFAEHADIRFHLLSQDPAAVSQWTAATARLTEASKTEVLQALPGWRYRTVAEIAASDTAEQFARSTPVGGVEAHIRQLVMACYFVALATGRTGQESLIADTLRWLRGSIAPEANRLLSEIHRRTSVHDEGLFEVANAVVREFIPAPALAQKLSETEVREAAASLHRRLALVALGSLPSGDYDLGGLLLDELLGFRRAEMTDQIRLHRLV